MDRNLEESREGIEQRIREIDATGLESLESRAERVYQYLRESDEFTNWDLICFCSQYLGGMIPVMNWIAKPVRQIGRMIHHQHYVLTEQLNQFEQPIKDFQRLNTHMEEGEEDEG